MNKIHMLKRNIITSIIGSIIIAFIGIGKINAVDFEVISLSTTQRTDRLLREDNSTNTTLIIQALTAGLLDTTYNDSAWVSVEVLFPETITDQAVHVNPVFNGLFPYLNAPDNTITFTNGVWSGSLLISRAKKYSNLYIHDANGNDGRSNVFNLYPGSLDTLWFELPEENFAPRGYYPGNQGSPSDIIAGQTLNLSDDCWVYAIDGSWNQVSLPTSPGTNMTIDSPTGGIDVPAAPYFMWDYGKTQIDNILFRRADPSMQLRATLEGAGGITGLSNTFRVLPGAYSKVILCAPDNQLIPGGEWRDDDGDTIPALEPKTFGDPLIQRIDNPFVVTVYLTDNYFNTTQMPPAGWPQIELYIDGGPMPVKTIDPLGSEFYETITLTAKGWHTIEFRDLSNPSRTDTVNINVISGEVETFEIVGVQNIGAGQLFNIDITARDGAGNIVEDFVGNVNVSLVSNGFPILYDGIIEPTTVYFPHVPTGGGKVTTTVRVYYAGSEMGFGDDNLQIKVSTFTPTEKYGLSNPFNIWETAFADIVLILSGQTYQPGGTPVKVNTANPVIAGDPFNIQLFAVDTYGNRVDYDGPVDLSLTDTEAHANFGGSTILFDGYRLRPITIYSAGTQTVNATIMATGYTDASDISILSRSYMEGTGKILLLAQGEIHKPGWMSVGKYGTPQQVVAHSSMTITVLACDKFYNIDTAFTGGSVSLTSDDGAINKSGISFVNGAAVVHNLYLRGGAGLTTVRITAVDDNDTNRTSFSDINVLEGARFSVTVPTATLVGADFSMSVELIDPETGLPGNFNHTIFLEAVRLDYSPGTIPLARTNLTLNSGTVTENQQHYDHVEHIRIKVTDNYGRIEYSDVIDVDPTGFKYVVDCPPQASADDDFNVSIKVYDTLFDSFVVTEAPEHQASIIILESLSGLPATGYYTIHQITVRNGDVQFKQHYTKAEAVILSATGTIGTYNAQGSDNINILVGNYVKVQIVAPGEIPLPGIPSATGKDSTNIQTQAANEPFYITVNAVDQYWNVATSIGSDRYVQLTASDGSLNNYSSAPFQNGSVELKDVILHVPPVVRVTASDTAGDVYSDSVEIYITGRTYKVVCLPNYPPSAPTRFITGKDFTVEVTLLKYTHDGSEAPIFKKVNFYLVPVNTNLEALDATRILNPYHQIDNNNPNKFETDPNPVARPDGSTAYLIQYTVAEDVIFKAYDDDGWVGYSEVIHFEPEDIYYEIQMPDEAVIGPPDTFIMKIIPRDVNTHTISINYASDVDIMVTDISNPTNQTDYSLLVERREITGGAIEFEQAITRAGIITFKVRDTNNNESQETSIILHAGPLAHVEEDIPETIEAGATREIHFTFYDHYNNPVRDVPVMLSLDDDLLNFKLGSLNTVSLQSNTLGTSQVRLSAMKGYSGLLFFTAHMGELNINEVIKVLGPPETTLFFGGLARDTFKGHSLKQTDPIILEADYDEELALDRVMYRIDDGEWLEYTGPFTISEVGIHTIEYYSVTVGELEHEENHKHSLKVFITQATTPDEGLVNYPNPFMAGKEPTFLEYYLVQNSNVTLSVYDLLGQKVYERDISAGQMGGVAGLNRIEWDGRNSDTRVIANGGYIAILDIKDEGRTLKRKIGVRK